MDHRNVNSPARGRRQRWRCLQEWTAGDQRIHRARIQQALGGEKATGGEFRHRCHLRRPHRPRNPGQRRGSKATQTSDVGRSPGSRKEEKNIVTEQILHARKLHLVFMWLNLFCVCKGGILCYIFNPLPSDWF